MRHIKEDMANRNIRNEFLDVFEYILDVATNRIDEERLVMDAKAINPQVVVLLICYSEILDLRFLLEAEGIFSIARFNRDICIQSKGQILTMTETQKVFLEIMTKPENITKKFIKIEGQVGCGKTLMGIEVLKMKISYYLRANKITAKVGIIKIRVIIIIYGGLSGVLETQLKLELEKEIGKQVTLTFHSMDHLEEKTLESMIEFDNFRYNIVMIDEANYDKMENYTVKNVPENVNIDYILCQKYKLFCRNSKLVSNHIQVENEQICVQLMDCQRSSQPILDLAKCIKKHSKPRDSNAPDPAIPDLPSKPSFSGPKLQWIEVSSSKAFQNYAEQNFANEKDVMMIYREIKCTEMESLCEKFNWKYCERREIHGSEAQMVILFDFPYFYYEACTRAKHQLIIVTLAGKQ